MYSMIQAKRVPTLSGLLYPGQQKSMDVFMWFQNAAITLYHIVSIPVFYCALVNLLVEHDIL